MGGEIAPVAAWHGRLDLRPNVSANVVLDSNQVAGDGIHRPVGRLAHGWVRRCSGSSRYGPNIGQRANRYAALLVAPVIQRITLCAVLSGATQDTVAQAVPGRVNDCRPHPPASPHVPTVRIDPSRLGRAHESYCRLGSSMHQGGGSMRTTRSSLRHRPRQR